MIEHIVFAVLFGLIVAEFVLRVYASLQTNKIASWYQNNTAKIELYRDVYIFLLIIATIIYHIIKLFI